MRLTTAELSFARICESIRAMWCNVQAANRKSSYLASGICNGGFSPACLRTHLICLSKLNWDEWGMSLTALLNTPMSCTSCSLQCPKEVDLLLTYCITSCQYRNTVPFRNTCCLMTCHSRYSQTRGSATRSSRAACGSFACDFEK